MLLCEIKIVEASEFKELKKNQKPLTPDERKLVMSRKAVWHHGINGAPSPAVWKSVNPKTNKVTFVTNTHRAYQVRSSLLATIHAFHSFIKSTA